MAPLDAVSDLSICGSGQAIGGARARRGVTATSQTQRRAWASRRPTAAARRGSCAWVISVGPSPILSKKERSPADSRITQRRSSRPSTAPLPRSPSTGTGGRHPPETVVPFNRKPRSPWTGARKAHKLFTVGPSAADLLLKYLGAFRGFEFGQLSGQRLALGAHPRVSVNRDTDLLFAHIICTTLRRVLYRSTSTFQTGTSRAGGVRTASAENRVEIGRKQLRKAAVTAGESRRPWENPRLLLAPTLGSLPSRPPSSDSGRGEG
jgi:hypothetical protein